MEFLSLYNFPFLISRQSLSAINILRVCVRLRVIRQVSRISANTQQMCRNTSRERRKRVKKKLHFRFPKMRNVAHSEQQVVSMTEGDVSAFKESRD
jgi:hypothetical protein